MSSTYNYNLPRAVPNFGILRCATMWAGALGLIQALIWIGLTITGIISYNCIIAVPNTSFGSIMQTMFMGLYFKSDSCTPDGYQDYNRDLFNGARPVLSTTGVLIWNCVYLGVAVCWLLTSVLLLTNVKKDDIQATLGVIYAWIIFTFFICLMDLALGIIFGIDYGTFHMRGYNYNANTINAGRVDDDAAQLTLAGVVAIALMIIAFKGFILWLINLGLLIYLLLHAINIASDKDGNDTLFMPRKDSDDILTTRPHINAYEDPKLSNNKLQPHQHNNHSHDSNNTMGYTNEAYAPDRRSMATTIDEDAIARAARMSNDGALLERRFRNLDSFHQYPPPARGTKQQYVNEESVVMATVAVSSYPVPDYSPQMQRSSKAQQQNAGNGGGGVQRNQRYH